MNRWMNTIAGYVGGTLMLACGVVAWALCTSWFGGRSPNPAMGFALAILLMFPALVVHELGHYASARLAGMTVLLMYVLGWEIHPQRRGWHVQRSPRRLSGISGYVFASPSPSRPMRPQVVALVAGGPAANLVVAAACGLVGWLGFPGSEGRLLLAFATLNAGFGVVNLIPHQTPMPSDGLSLYTWLRGVDETSPELAYTRVVAQAIAGRTADEIADDELATLESQPAHLPIFALWIRFKADQDRGAWKAAVAHADTLGTRVKALDPATRTAIAGLLALFRIELAFSRAMLTGDGAWLENGRLARKLVRSSRWLLPRCEALKAALRGDERSCMAWLETSRRHADNSLDGALVRSEARLRECVAAVGRRTSADRRGLD